MAKKKLAKRDRGLQAGPGTGTSLGTADSPHTGDAARGPRLAVNLASALSADE